MHCRYNHKVLKIVKIIQKRYYNKNTKKWYFPIEKYQSFKDSLSDPDYEYEITESKTVVFIKSLADRIEIKFSKFTLHHLEIAIDNLVLVPMLLLFSLTLVTI